MNSNENTDKAKGTTNNRAIECSLCAPFLSLLFSFAIFFFSFFLAQIFFLAFALLIFFSQQGAHNNKHQKKLSSIG
jgi:hypothetical protein